MRIGAYILFLLLAFQLAGQTIKIDTLKKQVAITTGKAQVDCLNKLGWHTDSFHDNKPKPFDDLLPC